MTETGARETRETGAALGQSALTEILKGRLVAAVGDLGVAARRRADAAAGVDQARRRADELLEAARREGRELVEAAGQGVRESLAAYEDAYTAALEAGWTAVELERIGYHPAAQEQTVRPPRPAETPVTPRISFSGRSADRPAWPPISPRRTRADDGSDDRE